VLGLGSLVELELLAHVDIADVADALGQRAVRAHDGLVETQRQVTLHAQHLIGSLAGRHRGVRCDADRIKECKKGKVHISKN